MNLANRSRSKPATTRATAVAAPSAGGRTKTPRGSPNKAPATRKQPSRAKAAKAAATAGRAKASKPSGPAEAKPAGARAGDAPAKGASRNPVASPSPKPERVKLVRDSFTMPKSDVELLAALKQRCLKLGHEAKKSELLRAGLHALAAMADEALLAAASSVPRLKTGRPGQKKGR